MPKAKKEYHLVSVVSQNLFNNAVNRQMEKGYHITPGTIRIDRREKAIRGSVFICQMERRVQKEK